MKVSRMVKMVRVILRFRVVICRFLRIWLRAMLVNLRVTLVVGRMLVGVVGIISMVVIYSLFVCFVIIWILDYLEVGLRVRGCR